MPKVNNIVSDTRSLSSASSNNGVSDENKPPNNGVLESALEDLTIKKRTNVPRTKKAKRISFYHNGNKHFNGIVIPVTTERYRSFDSLLSDLTNLLMRSVTLPSGVRTIFTMDGRKISSIDDLEDGKSYVCSGKGEQFKRMDYTRPELPKVKSTNVSNVTSTRPSTALVPRILPQDCVRPRIVILIRNGVKPRKVLRLLLNKRNASNMDQILSALTDAAQLDSGAVRKVFALSGQHVTSLPQFFGVEDVFFVYGNERFLLEDFVLDLEEIKAVRQYKKFAEPRNGVGPKPKMPQKQVNMKNSSPDMMLFNKDVCIYLPTPLNLKYSVGKAIGDGNFAVVRLCTDKFSNEEFALKIIDKSRSNGKGAMFENEVRILRRLSHPNIIKLIDEQDTKSLLYLVCEYVKGGDLFDATALAQKFSEDQASLMIEHLASALSYLHSLNIVHRDIKPENLLVDFELGKIKMLKLADFGLACEVTKSLYTVCGTPTYVAPEILAETGYGLKIDVWAAGVILYILLCGYPPFVSPDNDQEKLFDCILSGDYDFPDEYWGGVSSQGKELIQCMLQLLPEFRFSAEDVLDHPWIQNHGTCPDLPSD